MAEGAAPVIEPVARVYRLAQPRDSVVFLVSDRREKDRTGTEKNLRNAGLDHYAALYLKPDGFHDTTQDFKTATRKEIVGDGCIIVLNLGDQQSDFAGGYAELKFNTRSILPDRVTFRFRARRHRLRSSGNFPGSAGKSAGQAAGN